MTITNSTQRFVKESLSSPENQKHQFPVKYCYDPLDGGLEYLSPPRLGLNHTLEAHTQPSDHGIDLFPATAYLPWNSGILYGRQSKYWELVMEVSKTLLEYFAEDTLAQVLASSDKSLAEIARKELASGVETGVTMFPIYLYPDSEPRRIKLLADLFIYVFIFDDYWEMNDISLWNIIQDNWINRMRPNFRIHDKSSRTALQARIDETVQQCEELDRATDTTTGREAMNELVRFFDKPQPTANYRTLDEYFAYRNEDIAFPFVLASTRFSIASTVDYNHPKFSRCLRLLLDQIGLANDIASWEKEKRAYDTGKAFHVINAVQVIKEFSNLPNYKAAIGIAYAFQLQREVDLDAEVDRLMREEALSAEELRYINALVYCATGSLFTSVVSSRYGGEKARIA